MEKIKEYLKKYIYLVVIAIALLVAGTNYLVYPMFIKKNMNVITVPVAVEKINEATRIEETMITEMEIIDGFLPANVITDKSKLEGLYVKKGAIVPTNGFFYTDCLSTETQTLGEMFTNLNDGEYAYNLSTKSRWVINDNIKVGQYINLYITFNYLVNAQDGTLSDYKVQGAGYDVKNVYGQLAENVRVIAISNDKSVITLALKEEQLAQISLAEQFIESSRINNQIAGEIIPLIYFDSNLTEGHNTEYYDLNQTINWIMSKSEVLKVQILSDEELAQLNAQNEESAKEE